MAAMAQWWAAFLSRPFGDGREAEVASQGLQFGFPNAVEGFGEDDGQDGGSDAGDGAQDADGLGGSRRGRDGPVAKRGQDVFGGSSGAAFPEHGFDGGQAHAAGHQRRRGEGPEIKGPGPAEVRRGLEESGGSSA